MFESSAETFNPSYQLPLQSRLPVVAVVLSVVLHLFLAVPFFLPGQSVTQPRITYVDLTMAEQPATTAETKPVAGPEKVITEEPAMHEEKTEEKNIAEDVPAQEEVATKPQPREPVRDDFALGMMKGFFSTLANGRTLHPDLRDYYLGILTRVNERWLAVEADHRKIKTEIMAVLVIARNGTLVDGRIARSSGDPLLDALVIRTIREAGPYPPLPENFPQDFFQAPLRLVPPLNINIFETNG